MIILVNNNFKILLRKFEIEMRRKIDEETHKTLEILELKTKVGRQSK